MKTTLTTLTSLLILASSNVISSPYYVIINNDNIVTDIIEPVLPSLSVCKIEFTGLDLRPSGFYLSPGLGEMEFHTPEGSADLGAYISGNKTESILENATLSSSSTYNLGDFEPMYALADFVGAGENAWVSSEDYNQSFTIEFNTPMNLTGISYTDAPDGKRISSENYTLTLYDCSSNILKSYEIEQLVTTYLGGEIGTINFN